MVDVFKRTWAGILLPFFSERRQLQVAALCYQDTDAGRRVLLITSRDTGRWIVPKGWPIEGKDGAGSALQEAWEEAGVSVADVGADPIGHYTYDKGLSGGESIPIRAEVYLAKVQKMKENYPEADERERAWFTPGEAADLVDEPELSEIFRGL